MGEVIANTARAPGSSHSQPANLHPRLKNGYFILAAINGLATAYYISYIFFYMERNFGFSRADNLLLTTIYGFTYMISVSRSGPLAHRYGYFNLLRTGFLGMTLALLLGGLDPLVFGYSRAAMYSQFVVMGIWTVSTSLTWPSLQALLSHESPAELPRTVGIYNVIWAGGGAVSFFTGGALLDHVGREVLFWLPAGMHVVQLILLGPLQKLSVEAGPPAVVAAATGGESHPPSPRATAKAKAFVLLAWASNPFAYLAIYGLVPVVPQLAQRLGLSATWAGVVFSAWFWSRLGAFFLFWLWPGWHYRFRWLLTAFVAMIASFITILLSPNLPLLIAAQLVFGIAIGLIYYSSLYYTMDVGESKGKRGGMHEAVIGFGIFAGPAVGFTALRVFPGHPNAGTWNIAGALVLGLLLFLVIRWRYVNKAS